MPRNIRNGNNNGNGFFNNEQMKNDFENAKNQYSGMNESELMGELSKKVSEGRKNGSFTDESLSEFVKNISPMLNAEQKSKLQSIINKLK